MRILIFNWKDVRHPQSGGAEYATWELATHLVKYHHQVTIFTSRPKNTSSQEPSKGVMIYRQGNLYTVYWKAFLFYRKFHHNFDIVIDQIHGLPFFTPLYVRKPILAYIHEVAGPIWFKEFPFPYALFWWIIEHTYFLIYRSITFLTDTPSMVKELSKYGIRNNKIKIIPLTINRIKLLDISKNTHPTIIYIGRITPMKRIEIIIYATEILIKKYPNLEVIIAGKPKDKYLNSLKQKISDLNLHKNISIITNIKEELKMKLIRKAWIQVHPSIREGFGLNILEAASQGTPTIGFSVPGLSSTIKKNVNGYLLPRQDPLNLANKILNIFEQKNKLIKLQESAYKWAQKLPTFKKQTRILIALLQSLIKNNP